MDLSDLAFLMGGELPESDSSEHRNLWVVAETDAQGALTRATRQVMGKARELGDRLGTRVEAVLLGGPAAGQALVTLGADHVYALEAPELAPSNADGAVAALAAFAGEKKPEIVLFPGGGLYAEVAPRVAARLGTGLTAEASGLDLEESERLLLATRASFGGRALATVQCPKARPQMVTVRPNAFGEPVPDGYRSGDVESVSVGAEADRLIHLGAEPAREKLPVGRAKALVVVGKGLADAEGLALAKQLAAALGAQLAGTHSAVEAGHVAAEDEVSQLGNTVAPELYVGIGVSGSMQHVDAMRQSRTIVAINTSATAPLMELADYAIEGDYREVVPAFLKALEAKRAQRQAALAR